MQDLATEAALLSGSALPVGISNADNRMLTSEHQEFMAVLKNEWGISKSDT